MAPDDGTPIASQTTRRTGKDVMVTHVAFDIVSPVPSLGPIEVQAVAVRHEELEQAAKRAIELVPGIDADTIKVTPAKLEKR